ncbi:MAG: hypothetical protein ABIX28_25435 [Vicinamibacterales bacterium]
MRHLTVAWMAGLSLVASAGAARAQTTGLSPEARAMAQLLAATASRDPIQSCAADAPAMLPPAMYARGGVSAGLAGGAPNGLWVQCSLPFTNGKPGGDCEGKHSMQWRVLNGGPDLKVTAELIGLDANGQFISGFPVKLGENVQMNSRISPTDWKFAKGKGTYDIFAPVPLLKVTAVSNGETAEAYCTNIPWVDMIKPDGGVVSATSDGAVVDFKAAIPRTDPFKLELQLDGVNLLPLIAAQEGGLQNCRFDSPCEGNLAVPQVKYSNVIIDLAADIGQLASNTISGSLEGLECGGHLVRVETGPALNFRRKSSQCNVDDLVDKGSASIFSVIVDEIGGLATAPGLITAQTPTGVKGEICAGAPIVSANVNGKILSLAGQVTVDKGVTSDGDPIGLKVTLAIDTALAKTDLRADLDGATTELGTFHPGSNRLVAVAMEASKGARAFDRHIFAVGNNIKPLGVDPSATIIQPQALSNVVNAKVQSALQAKMDQVLNMQTETKVKNAFVLGLSAEGAQTIIDSLCVDPLPGDGRTLGQIFKATAEDVLDNFTVQNPLTSFGFDPICSCATTVKVFVESVQADADFACPLKFEDHKITATLKLPDVTVRVRATGPKESCVEVYPLPVPPFFIPLPTSTEVDAYAQVKLDDISFSYTITENDLKNKTTTVSTDPTDPPFKVGGKVEIDNGGFGVSGGAGIKYGIGGEYCNFLLDAFVTVLTFGQVDIGPLLDLSIDISQTIDLADQLKPAQPNALPLPDVRVKEQTVEPYHQKMSGEVSLVSDIHITGPTAAAPFSGAGITVGLTGTFATTKLDLDVEGNPGIEVLESNLPTMKQMQDQGATDALVGLSQDAINMLFASLAGGGDLKVPNSDAQGCFLGAKLTDVLPQNCDTLQLPGLTHLGLEAVATIRGICHGIRRDPCDPLTYTDPDIADGDNLTQLLTGTIRGVCHGVTPDATPTAPGDQACLFVSPEGDLVEIGSCFAAQGLNLNLDKTDNVMFCVKGDIPTMTFPNNPAINGVTSDLALNDLSVSLIVDRDGNGAVDGPINSLPGCFTGLETNKDCNVVAACLDINFRFAMHNTICAADPGIPGDTAKPGFQAEFLDFLPIVRQIGEVCSGTTPPPSPDTQVLEASSNHDGVTGPLAQNAGLLSPPICGAGLDMGGFVTCDNAKILGLESNGDPKFKEFLALTCILK